MWRSVWESTTRWGVKAPGVKRRVGKDRTIKRGGTVTGDGVKGFTFCGRERVHHVRSGGAVVEDGGGHCLSGFGAYPHLERRGSGEECLLNSPTLSPFLVKNVYICIKSK